MKEIMFKKLDGQNIVIREFLGKDYRDLYEVLSNYNVCKYLIHNPAETKNEMRIYIRNIIEEYKQKGAYKVAIVLKETNKVIGYIGLSKQELSINKCQVIYAINESYWHHGYTSEALKMFVEYLINVEKRKIVIARHVSKNIYSGKVMEKAGFSRDESLDMEMMVHGIKEKLIGYSYRSNK